VAWTVCFCYTCDKDTAEQITAETIANNEFCTFPLFSVFFSQVRIPILQVTVLVMDQQHQIGSTWLFGQKRIICYLYQVLDQGKVVFIGPSVFVKEKNLS
jgi:hypothetical protein